jgi:hypothetical protein
VRARSTVRDNRQEGRTAATSRPVVGPAATMRHALLRDSRCMPIRHNLCDLFFRPCLATTVYVQYFRKSAIKFNRTGSSLFLHADIYLQRQHCNSSIDWWSCKLQGSYRQHQRRGGRRFWMAAQVLGHKNTN